MVYHTYLVGVVRTYEPTEVPGQRYVAPTCLPAYLPTCLLMPHSSTLSPSHLLRISVFVVGRYRFRLLVSKVSNQEGFLRKDEVPCTPLAPCNTYFPLVCMAFYNAAILVNFFTMAHEYIRGGG